MSELELRIKAKIPGEDTGIKVKRSFCAICSPTHHCGLDCYVKDGKLIKVEGTIEHPYNQGKICAKGVNNRQYVYRKDRIQTPLLRVGERGEGKFTPISWEKAYAITAEKLNLVKEQYGPHAVAFFSGYCKWYRPLLHRLAYAFGSINYGTDDSTCNRAGVLASQVTSGSGTAGPDIGNANTFVGWAYGGYYTGHLSVQGIQDLKARGGKVIMIDSRITPAFKNLADLALHINPGTDGALALCMANIIIEKGWADMDYVQKHTYGFDQYREYVKTFDLETVSRICGLNPSDIVEAAKIYSTNGPACINQSASTLPHYINGFQTFRAILCLTALTGNFDRLGGNYPNPNSYLHKPAGVKTREKEFYTDIKPRDAKMIAEGKFPVWDMFCNEFQSMDLSRQILESTPYPIRAISGWGMNVKMFPATDQLIEAIKTLDFFVNTDLFMTETCKYADIVLPVCTSLERSEFKMYQGGYAVFTEPVIEPLFQSKPDTDVICELAQALELQDEWLDRGYEACIDYIIEGCGLTVADLKGQEFPVKMPAAHPAEPGDYIKEGFKTTTGKFEFYSTTLARFSESHVLQPLPVYTPPLSDEDVESWKSEYPFNLSTGVRIPTAIHSRLHEVPWARSVQPYATCEINREDGEELGIQDGDDVILYNMHGSICVKAKLTIKNKRGHINMVHGYTEANVNLLIGREHLDPYSGFPGFKATRCNIRKQQ